MNLRLGVFLVPDASDPAMAIGQILAADRAGLDFGAVDHPYRRRFFETWTPLA